VICFADALKMNARKKIPTTIRFFFILHYFFLKRLYKRSISQNKAMGILKIHTNLAGKK
jgi:hypothetical protein